MAKVILTQSDLEDAVKCKLEEMGLTNIQIKSIDFRPKRKTSLDDDSIDCLVVMNPRSKNEEEINIEIINNNADLFNME